MTSHMQTDAHRTRPVQAEVSGHSATLSIHIGAPVQGRRVSKFSLSSIDDMRRCTRRKQNPLRADPEAGSIRDAPHSGGCLHGEGIPSQPYARSPACKR
jgi:hypothetical protein